MISVFDIGNTNYTGNGNAVLQPKECKLRNIAGGNYDLTMSHPIDPEGKWKHLAPGAIIKAPVPREEIENAFAGYDADVYKTTGQAALREGPSEPSTITYPAWSQYSTYSPGSKVSSGGKNYECTYFDPNSTYRAESPGASSWWREIPRSTPGAAALVTLAAGTDLYFVEDYDSTWYKMSTYYGIVGYIKKTDVVYDRHLSPSETKPRIITEQLFRIEKPTVDTKNRTVTVNAKHVSYDLAGILVKDVSIAQATPAMALGRINEGLMMDYEGTIATNLTSDANGTYTGDIKGKNGIFALLDPDKGIVSTFNAAYKRDNWDLFVMKKTDVDRGYRLKYRKNMLGVNWAQDSSGLVTRVVPVAKDEAGADLYLPETWVDSPLINNYPKIRMESLSVKGQVGKDKGTGDGSTWTESDLLDEMRAKAGERFSVDKADRIAVTVTVDFEQLGDTEEHRELMGLETVLLYDTVSVENEEIGLDIQLYVSEWEWDAIRQKITALKLVNTTDYQKGNVTGYNVQSKSIGSDKLSDDVAGDILEQVVDIIPEYADPQAARPASNVVANSKDDDGIVMKGSGNANKVWGTDAQGNPGWTNPGGVSGNEIVYYGTCDTAAGTRDKVATVANFPSELATGQKVLIKFDNAQDYNGTPRLKINSLSVQNIRRNAGTNATKGEWAAHDVILFVCIGSYWVIGGGGVAGTSYYGKTMLTNALDSTSEALALSAKAGKALKDQIDAVVIETNGTYSFPTNGVYNTGITASKRALIQCYTTTGVLILPFVYSGKWYLKALYPETMQPYSGSQTVYMLYIEQNNLS